MRTKLIAELASNAGGDLRHATRLITQAASHGADIIKVQAYQTKYLKPDDPQYAWLKQAEWSIGDLVTLRDTCEANGVEFLASVFDLESARRIRSLGCESVKMGSGEIYRRQFLLDLYDLHFDVMFIGVGLDRLRPEDFALLEPIYFYGVSQYPTPQVRARAELYAAMRRPEFNPLRWGWSDHTNSLSFAFDVLEHRPTYFERHISLPDSPRTSSWDSLPWELADLRDHAERCAWHGTADHWTACETYVSRWVNADEPLQG